MQRPDVKKAQAALSTLGSTEEGMDVDVRAEQEKMKARCESYIARKGLTAEQGGQRYAAEMFGLKKVYEPRWKGFLRRRKGFTAVAGNCFGVLEGECFCLLGPNGAGKTTTIHCLTGVLPFSAGDALVYGTSIAQSNGLEQIRPLMGVCPQV